MPILHVDTNKHGGWKGVPTEHTLKALRFAGVPAGDSILADVVPADETDLSSSLPQEPLDQGSLGSCTANAVVQAIYAAMVKNNLPPYIASRIALYHWSLCQTGNAQSDDGTYIATEFDMAANLGLPPELIWPYDTTKFSLTPNPDTYRAAYDSRGQIGVNYHPLSSPSTLVIDITKALTKGFVVPFGIQVSEEFCSTQPSGIVQPPAGKIAGGHAMVIVGHSKAKKAFLARNSWGIWGDPTLPPGYFWISYDYIAQASDCWIVLTAPKGTV